MNRYKHIRTANPGLCGLSGHAAPLCYQCRRAFSLLELMVVIAVALILTSLLLPALNSVRENVNRVVCASNLRQISVALFLFAEDHHGRLPGSMMLDPNSDVWRPYELMASRQSGFTAQGAKWDGIGRLFELEYCRDAACFYCPSHFGEHPFERYKNEWNQPSTTPIYTNYHYAGAYNWETRMPRYLTRPSQMIVATDGLRTLSDINHVHGLNAARGDGSVRWRSDTAQIHPMLPENGEDPPDPSEYNSIWNTLERPINTTPYIPSN